MAKKKQTVDEQAEAEALHEGVIGEAIRYVGPNPAPNQVGPYDLTELALTPGKVAHVPMGAAAALVRYYPELFEEA